MGDLFGFAQSVVSISVRVFHLVLRHVAWYLLWSGDKLLILGTERKCSWIHW